MARLRHPNHWTVYDVGVDGNIPFIVMELLEGGALQDYIERSGSFSPPLAAKLMQGMLYGLQEAHDNKVVHRDIKPHNILLSTEGKPKLTDFGIAQVSDTDHSMTKTGSILGTLAYMAPEQRMDAKAANHTADIYASGATLYSLVKAIQPFDLYATEFHKKVFEGVPETCSEVIKKACEFDQDERYQSPKLMADALQGLVDALTDEAWQDFLSQVQTPESQQGTMAWDPQTRWSRWATTSPDLSLQREAGRVGGCELARQPRRAGSGHQRPRDARLRARDPRARCRWYWDWWPSWRGRWRSGVPKQRKTRHSRRTDLSEAAHAPARTPWDRPRRGGRSQEASAKARRRERHRKTCRKPRDRACNRGAARAAPAGATPEPTPVRERPRRIETAKPEPVRAAAPAPAPAEPEPEPDRSPSPHRHSRTCRPESTPFRRAAFVDGVAIGPTWWVGKRLPDPTAFA